MKHTIPKPPPAVRLGLDAIRRDPALNTRGDRKLMVTQLYAATEGVVSAAQWEPPTSASGKCPVLVMRDTELAVFTQAAKQTRHCHSHATEIYSPIEGRMMIEVEGVDYALAPGDLLIVNPGAYHEVKRNEEFLCRVVIVNSTGAADRREG